MTVDGLSGVSITVVGETMVSNLNVSGVRVSIFRFLESVLDCDGLGGSDGGKDVISDSFGMEGIGVSVRVLLVCSLC